MRALTVRPSRAGSVGTAEVPDPVPGDRDLLVRGLAVGVCGTDAEIVAGDYGWAPPGRDELILGHESVGRVVSAPPGSAFAEGDLVVGVVRRPDPVPCAACAAGEFDTCRNGRYTERGIKELDGYGSELWSVEEEYAVGIDRRLDDVAALLEPTSVVAKAWEQIERVGARSWFQPRTVLITGAGPIGLLAALLGAQRGLDVHVLDLVTSGPKPDAAGALGVQYHHAGIDVVATRLTPDIVIEATGVSQVAFEAMVGIGQYGIVCLTGVYPSGRRITVDVGGRYRGMVLQNAAVIGSVNANLRHYAAAANALAKADLGWLQRLITRRIPLSRAREAFDGGGDEIKVLITLDD